MSHILNEYRQRLIEILGADLDSVLLYGSQARGDAGPGSDIDVFCIMKNPLNMPTLSAALRWQQPKSASNMTLSSRVFLSRAKHMHPRTVRF